MHTVSISDGVYERAAQRAQAHGVKVEAYIEVAISEIMDAEQQHEDELRQPLTPELQAKVERSRQQISEGKFHTPEQVREKLTQNALAWQNP